MEGARSMLGRWRMAGGGWWAVLAGVLVKK
jgi:hypothetical protein